MGAFPSTHRLEALGVPALGLLLGLTCQPMPPGGPEVLCNGSQERWLTIPAAGIPWQVAGGPAGTRLAPGLPPLLCQYSSTQNGTPGIQSMARAANTWSNVLVPFPSAGGPVLQPNPTPKASTFRLTDGPSAILTWATYLENDVNRMNAGVPSGSGPVGDGINLVTCWQPPLWWGPLGGGQALGVAQVELNGAPGEITECDIALNVRSYDLNNQQRPVWSFVESNAAMQAEVATHRWDIASGLPYVDPLLGYADLEGVMVHEFGHFAGLAHSLVDSRQRDGNSMFPTMFPVAQTQNYASTLTFIGLGGCTDFVLQPSNAAATVFGGRLGASARTLEIDDISAIGVVYGTPELNAYTGRIQGTCYLNGLTMPLPGAHLVAYRTDLVDQVRVGTLAYANGQYTLNGLPPGEYYVYAEPVDQPGFLAPNTGQYFFGADVPEFVLPGNCLSTNVIRFQTEFYDATESFFETSPAVASKVVVVAGQATTGIDFHLSSQSDLLTVRLPNSPYASPRGVIVSPQGTPSPNVEIRVQAGSGYANQPVSVSIATARGVRILSGQLLVPFTQGATVLTGTLDATGSATFSVATNQWTFQNRFVQARVGTGTAVLYSNCANIWVASR